jgi:signal transduction histidine kinase/ligand-binding sensor domain-containing protein
MPTTVVAVAIALSTSLAAVATRRAWALDPGKTLQECAVEVWSTRHGLAGTLVRDIVQTPDGYLWLAGYGSVGRYDGARVVRVEIEPPVDVMGIVPGVDDVLMIPPRRGAPICARGTTLVPCPASAPSIPNGKRLLAIHRDASGDFWMGSDDGLYHLRGSRLIAHYASPRAPADVSAVMRDRRGRVWVGSTSGLFVHQGAPGPGESFAAHGTSASPVRAMSEGREADLWVLTDAGLLRVLADRTETFPVPANFGTSWKSQVMEDRDGNVWIGTEAGLTRFRDGRFLTFTRKDGLPDDDVTALHEDREGSLWVGTRSGALAQFTDRTLDTRGGPPSVREISIESVCEDDEGAMWLGTFRGLTRWKDGQERTYTKADGLPHDQVLAIRPGTAPGELWVGTGGGLLRRRNGRFETPLAFPAAIFSLYLDPRGTLWIGTDTGLARLGKGDRVERVPAEPGFDPRQVRGMQEDDAGTLWVTSVGGLGRVQDGKLIRAQAQRPESTATKADRGISRDSDGTLWFGAGASLMRLRNGAFRAFTAAHGLTGDWLFQVMPDDHGNLWIATSRAIMRVSKHELEDVDKGRRERVAVVSFETSDKRREVAARRSRTPGAWKTRDGRLWFATLSGVVTIDPRQVRTNPLPPPVVIEHALVDGAPAAVGQENHFPPGPGNLEFHFAGVTLLEPHKATHRYRLEGFDRTWVDAGSRRVASYANIGPGSYRFRVQVANADGVWNEKGATLALRLAPHYYQTAWFYALCALALVGVGFSLHRTRLRRLRGQYLAVFAERSRVARELHDSLLQGMSAVALELGNVREQLPGSAAAAAQRLHNAENALTASLEETRRFVWNLREQPTGTGDLGLALNRLAGRLTEGKDVTCEVHVEGTAIHLTHEVQGSLFRIAQEAVANALKHGDPRRVEVRLRYQERAVELTVSDDGPGFDAREEPGAGHFGLVGMRERAAKVGAILVVDSRPGEGTRVTFTVPVAPPGARSAE